MSTPSVSNDELYNAAQEMTDALVEMCALDGIFTGPYENEIQFAVRDRVEDFMSMDPARLAEEYDALMGAADLAFADPTDQIGQLSVEIGSSWVGDAATAFTNQLGKIKNCFTQQHEYTQYAAYALGMMYATSVQCRRSYLDLLRKTTQRCNEVIAGIAAEPGLDWKKIGIELFKLVKDVVETKGNPAELGKLAIDKFVDAADAALEPGKVAGTEANPVLTEYITNSDELFESYQTALRDIAGWLHDRADNLTTKANTIPEPLETRFDVDSPEFRYEYLANTSQADIDLGPEVARERQRYAEEKATGGGLIGQRLSGER